MRSPRAHSHATPWLYVIGILTTTTIARGASTPVRVEVTRESACGDASSVEARIVARGVVVSDSAPTSAVFTVTETGAAMDGSLALRGPSGTTTRTVTATTCGDVLDALAFTLVLALEDGVAVAAPTRAPAPPPAPPVRAPAPPARSHLLEMAAGASGGGIRAVAPVVSGAATAWAMIGVRRATWLSPSASVGVAFGLPVEMRTGSSRATVALQAATVDLCPARLGVERLRVRLCGHIMVGRSQVRSEGFVGARIDERAFMIAGLAARAEAGIGGPLFVHLHLAGGMPVDRATYFVGDSQIFDTPPVAVSGTLGLGVHFL